MLAPMHNPKSLNITRVLGIMLPRVPASMVTGAERASCKQGALGSVYLERMILVFEEVIVRLYPMT